METLAEVLSKYLTRLAFNGVSQSLASELAVPAFYAGAAAMATHFAAGELQKIKSSPEIAANIGNYLLLQEREKEAGYLLSHAGPAISLTRVECKDWIDRHFKWQLGFRGATDPQP